METHEEDNDEKEATMKEEARLLYSPVAYERKQKKIMNEISNL